MDSSGHWQFLARQVLFETLHISSFADATERDGVDESRLEQFGEDACYGPKIRHTRLDTRGESVEELKARPWNKALLHLLASELTHFASESHDKRLKTMRKYESWRNLYDERLGRIFGDIVDVLPKEGETIAQVLQRKAAKVAKEYDRKGKTSAARAVSPLCPKLILLISSTPKKFQGRLATARLMEKITQSRKDEQGLAFWRYVANLVDELGAEGMSDEEEVEVPVEGRQTTRKAKKILKMPWRNPHIEQLMLRLDETPHLEAHIFSRSGSKKMERFRCEELSSRLPPSGYRCSYFSPKWLTTLMDYELKDLKIRVPDIPMRPFATFKYTVPREDDE